MNENTKYNQPEVVFLGTAGDLVQGDKIGVGESGLDALQMIDVD